MIERTVQRLIRKYKTSDPFEIATAMNINISFLDLPDDCRGYYLRTLRRRFIAINSNLSEEWQRIVCAHELGHDQLHRGMSRFFLNEKTFFSAGKYEVEANEFAVNLLLYDQRPEEDEAMSHFFARNNLPVEMIKFY